MSEKRQKILCGMLLAVGLTTFILQVFVFQKPDGNLGFVICLACVYLIIGSVIRLCKLSERFKHNLFQLFESLL